jgi:serine/threonine protein kinase
MNDPLLGRVLDGRFTLQSVLGRGGMGVVYRAHQASLERSVALKVMSGVEPEREQEFQRRFFLEAATVARLKHPNTITVFDYGSSLVDGERVFFIAMELLEGTTLTKQMTGGRRLLPMRAVHIALQIARSLREAHQAGVVHRDLKPGNVMIVRQDDDDADGDFVKVLDFGLAKTHQFDGAKPVAGLTKTGTFMGSPRYVAPEQIEGRAVDNRADIYSLGCVLYRMLSGRVPFDGQQPVEIMLKHLHDPLPELDVPGLPLTLHRLVRDCLAKKAADRPATMDEVIKRLKLARAELGGQGSGVMVVSDERGSLAEQRAVEVDSLPPAPPPPPPARASRAAVERALTIEDSTRPTRILRAMKRPPKRPIFPVAAGITIGLALCAGLVSWRLGGLDPLIARLRAPVPRATLMMTAEPAVPGPFAKQARVRIRTVPPGADVLEIHDGLPRLLGTTPLTLSWDIPADARPRELLLRKDGFHPARARVVPPPPADREPVWLDVDAVLRQQ